MIIIIVLGLVMLLPDQDQTKALTRQVTAGSKRSGCSLSGGFSDLTQWSPDANKLQHP